MEPRMVKGTNQTSPVNDSRWFEHGFDGYPFVYSIILYYLYPVVLFGRIMHVAWYIIGMIGNVISMKIWMIPRMRRLNKSALYLVSLTLCDIAIQVLHFFSYLKYFWGVPALGVTVVCEVWNILNMIPQYSSQMLVLGFTAEKFISIYKPFRSERFSKRQRAPRTICIIFLTAVAMSLIQGYFWGVDSLAFCELRHVTNLDKIYFIWSLATETVFYFVVPVLTLLLNICVLKETCKSFQDHDLDNNENLGDSRVHRKTPKTFRPATVTLVSISFFRICTQLPISVTYTLQNVDSFTFGRRMPIPEMQFDPQWQRFFSYWSARIIVEAIGVSYHALSVFIFYVSTKQFRKEIKRLFLKTKSGVFHRRNDQTESMFFRSGLGQSISRTASNTVKTRLFYPKEATELNEQL